MSELWVFAYGSLMWRPGFTFAEVRPATLMGYRRCFCITSVHHRGTSQRPGLVLGLDRGGVCHGLAYRIPDVQRVETVAYLRAREQINGVYREVRLPLELDGDMTVDGLAYIAERAHPSFTGRLPLTVQARFIRAAVGSSGTNLDYLANTLARLALLGIRERELERVQTLTGLMFCRGGDTPVRTARTRSLVQSMRALPLRVIRMRPGDRKRFGYRQGADF